MHNLLLHEHIETVPGGSCWTGITGVWHGGNSFFCRLKPISKGFDVIFGDTPMILLDICKGKRDLLICGVTRLVLLTKLVNVRGVQWEVKGF